MGFIYYSLSETLTLICFYTQLGKLLGASSTKSKLETIQAKQKKEGKNVVS